MKHEKEYTIVADLILTQVTVVKASSAEEAFELANQTSDWQEIDCETINMRLADGA